MIDVDRAWEGYLKAQESGFAAIVVTVSMLRSSRFTSILTTVWFLGQIFVLLTMTLWRAKLFLSQNSKIECCVTSIDTH